MIRARSITIGIQNNIVFNTVFIIVFNSKILFRKVTIFKLMNIIKLDLGPSPRR